MYYSVTCLVHRTWKHETWLGFNFVLEEASRSKQCLTVIANAKARNIYLVNRNDEKNIGTYPTSYVFADIIHLHHIVKFFLVLQLSSQLYLSLSFLSFFFFFFVKQLIQIYGPKKGYFSPCITLVHVTPALVPQYILPHVSTMPEAIRHPYIEGRFACTRTTVTVGQERIFRFFSLFLYSCFPTATFRVFLERSSFKSGWT